jgi:hypothetical protein
MHLDKHPFWAVVATSNQLYGHERETESKGDYIVLPLQIAVAILIMFKSEI